MCLSFLGTMVLFFHAKSYMNVPIYITLTLAVFDFLKIAILMGMSSVSFWF